MRFLTSLLIALALLMAGCTDDSASAGGGADATDDDAGDDGTDPGDDGDETGNTTEPEEPAYEPTYYNGTVTGALDCSLVSNDQSPQSAETVSLAAEDANRTFTVSKVAPSDGTPDTAILCISLDAGSTWQTELSGTVPADATEIRIAADRAPAGVGYSVYIE